MSLKSQNGKLLSSDGHLCLTCCCANPWEWTFSTQGGCSWTEPADKTVRVSFLDSLECGGSCNVPQYGRASCCFIAPADGTLYISAAGRVETQNEGFDLVRVSINGSVVLTDASDKSGGECVMEDRTAAATSPLVAGTTYRIIVEGDTGDEKYHVGSYWQVQISLSGMLSVPARTMAAVHPSVEAIESARRFGICKGCADALQDGFACARTAGCCFGRRRANLAFHCPSGKW